MEVNKNYATLLSDNGMGKSGKAQTRSEKEVKNIKEGMKKENGTQEKKCHYDNESVKLEEVVVVDVAEASVEDNSNRHTGNVKNVTNDKMDTANVSDNEMLPVKTSRPSSQNFDINNENEVFQSAELCEKSEQSVTKDELVCNVTNPTDTESKAVEDEEQKQSRPTVTGSVRAEAGVEPSPSCETEPLRPENSTPPSLSKSSHGKEKVIPIEEKDCNYPPPTIFKGLCFKFMREHCRCDKFSHKYPPQFLQTLESSNSWEIYSILRFAIHRDLRTFLQRYSIELGRILACRKEGNLFAAILLEYQNKMMGGTSFWHRNLKLVSECGNCDERSSFEILRHMISEILLKQKMLEKVYFSMVENIIIISSTFKDPQRLCGILDLIANKEVFVEEYAVKTLLERCFSTTFEPDRNNLFQSVGFTLLITNFAVPLEENTTKLLVKLINALKRYGHGELAKQLKDKHCRKVSDGPQPRIDSDLVIKPISGGGVNEKSAELTLSPKGSKEPMGTELQGRKRHPRSKAGGCLPCKKAKISSGQSKVYDSDRSSSLTIPEEEKAHCGMQSIEVFVSHSRKRKNQPRNYVTYEASTSSLADLSTATNADSFSRNRQGPSGFQGSLGRKGYNTPLLPSPTPPDLDRCLFPVGKVVPKKGRSSDWNKNIFPSSSYNQSLNEHGAFLETPVGGNQSGSGGPVGPEGSQIDSRQLFCQNMLRELSEVSSNISSSSGNRKSRSGDPHVQFQPAEVRNSQSFISGDISESMTDQNLSEQPSSGTSSSVISWSHLCEEPEMASEKVLEKALRKAKWSPDSVISTFNPWLSTTKLHKQLSRLSCKILERDLRIAASSLQSLLHCMGSKEVKSHKNFKTIMAIISAIVFNMILKMVTSDALDEAHKLLTMAESENVPLMFSEAFIKEKMSTSRKLLILSEICFHVEEMDEAIAYLKDGNLFGPPSVWKYSYLDGDLDVWTALLSSLIGRLATGGYLETAPATFLRIYKSQQSLLKPIDLLNHANKVILCVLNGSCIKKAYEVYLTLFNSGAVLPKTTYRALLIGLVSNKEYSKAREMFLDVCKLKIYPPFRVFDTPEDLSVTWNPMKGNGDPIPHSLALVSNTLEDAHTRVAYVLQEMFRPAILYDSIIIENDLKELLTLHPASLEEHIYTRFVCNDGYRE